MSLIYYGYTQRESAISPFKGLYKKDCTLFLVDALEKDSVDDLKEYAADNLLNFLTRQEDKDLMLDLVKGLGGKLETKNRL